jgi:hypothetical protein
MASLRKEEIETTATVRVASLEKEESFGKAVTQRLISQLRVI